MAWYPFSALSVAYVEAPLLMTDFVTSELGLDEQINKTTRQLAVSISRRGRATGLMATLKNRVRSVSPQKAGQPSSRRAEVSEP